MPKDKKSPSPSKGGKIPSICQKTGGKVDDVVLRLLKHGDDGEMDVQNEIFQSLSIIGKKQPLFVVTQSIDFINRQSPKTAHRARILELIAQIIEEETCGDNKCELFEEDLAKNIIKFGTLQMTEMKNQPQVQNNAVKLLVALSFQNCSSVIESVLKYFKTGSIPSYYVLKSLADTAKSNPIAFTEKLSEIFTKITPILAMVKKPDHIQIFTLALGRFAEAILKYHEEREEQILRKQDEENNPFQKEEKTQEKEMNIQFTEFATNCAAAFDVVFTNWRKQSNVSIRLAVAESIGLLTEVMSKKKFASKFVDILSYFATSLKSAQSNLAHQPPLTRGMCSVLKVMCRDELADGAIDDIEKQLQVAMDVLHPLCSKNPNYDKPKQVKNHTNILMSFEFIARSRLTQTLTYLLSKFQTKSSSKSQLSSLLILKHLVNAMDDRLDGVKEQILSSCLQLMDVSNMDVRKAFIQLIMAMADQKYLSLEGGQNMIMFLVKMCSIKQTKNDEMSKQIKSGADHILHVIASKVESSHNVLWPYLFELIIPAKNQFAVGTISRVLSLIARHKKSQNAQDLNIKWHKDVNLPHPGHIICKLFILLHRPYLHKNYGEYICALLYNIGGLLHSDLATLFVDNFKILGKFIKDNVKSDSTQKKLQSMLLKLFRSTCQKLENDDSFITEMGDSICRQFKHYMTDSYLQEQSLIYLGVILSFSNKKSWLTATLKTMVDKLCDIQKSDHINGCALGLALCSVTHLDTVLLRTTDLITDSEQKGKSGLFGFGKKKELPGSKEKKSLCVKCWGYICKYCPAKTCCSRLDAHVFVHLLKVMNATNICDDVRRNVINSVCMIATAMNANYDETKYQIKKKSEFVKGMLKYIKQCKSESMKKCAMNSIASLVYLSPPILIEDDLRMQIIEITLKHLNNCKVGNDDEKDKENDQVTSGVNEDEIENISLLQCMQNILIGLLETQPSVESLCQLIFKLEFWVVSKVENERICALECYKLLSKRFIGILRKGQNLKAKDGKMANLKNLGHYLATIIPRVTDKNVFVRNLAMDNIQMLLFIDQLLRSQGSNEKPSAELRALNLLKKELSTEKIEETRLAKMYFLSEIVCKLCSANEMQSLLVNLIRGVNDDDSQSSLGTCKALQGILRERALETKQYVDKLLDINLIELKKLQNSKKQNVTKQQLISICILTREHFDDILRILHQQNMPLDKATILVFKALAADPKLQKKVIEYELNVINTSPINEFGTTKNVCIATKALQTIFTLSESEQIIKSDAYYYQFTATLLCRLGTAICKKTKKTTSGPPTKKAPTKSKTNSPKNAKSKSKSPKKAKKKSNDDKKEKSDDETSDEKKKKESKNYAVFDTIAAIKYFLQSADEKLLLNNMNEDETWKKFENSKNYEIGVAEFIQKWCETRRDKECKIKLFEAVLPYFKKHVIGMRNSAAVVVAELIRHSNDDQTFLDGLVKELLPRISDNEPRVRRQGLVGLGNLSDVWSDHLISSGVGPAILSSLSSAVEDKIEIVCISALKSLIKILRVIDVKTVTPSLINICFRTRPFLDSPNAEIRQESFKLFGKLCKFGKDNYNFCEQIHKNMTCLFCHINDVNDGVSKEVYNSLLIIFKYLADDAVIGQVLTPQDNFEASCNEVIGKENFISFLVHIVPILTDEKERKYYDHLTLYLQAAVEYMNTSRWGELRGNAALFAAKLMQSVDKEYAATHLDCNTGINAMMKLLQSKSVRVRRRTAKALSYLAET